MRNKIILGALAVAVVAGGYFLTKPSEKTNNNQNPVAQTQTDTSNVTEDKLPEEQGQAPVENTAGQYLKYSEASFAETTGTKLLFFHASWCPQCVALEQDIVANGVPAGVTIFEVDYDSNKDLRKKYGITIQTTVVKVDDNGDLIAKFNAYNSPNIDAVSANLL